MQLNSKYFVAPQRFEEVMSSIQKRLLSKKQSKEITIIVTSNEFFQTANDVVSIESVYDPDQLTKKGFKGKPRNIRLKRENPGAVNLTELGYTSIIDLRRVLEFCHFLSFGSIIQFRTSFTLSTELIELPITIAETREFGCFIEVGDVVGAVSEIDYLLNVLSKVTLLQEEDSVSEAYSTLLLRAKNRS